jgi:hypothetical protein
MTKINTAEIEARHADRHGKLLFGPITEPWEISTFNDISTLLNALKAETARADEAEEELEEQRSWWPKWGLEIKAILERHGVDYSYTDEINLPGDLEDWIAEWTSADKAKQDDLQSQLTAANEKLAAAQSIEDALRNELDKANALATKTHRQLIELQERTGDGNGR